MKRIQVGVVIFALAIAAHARAADSGPAATCSGTVMDEQGRPVAGATVDAYVYESSEMRFRNYGEPALSQHTVTDSNGAFALPPSPGGTLAVVKKAGLATAWKTWSSHHENSSDPVVLTTPTPLAGIVLDESNRPVAGAQVWVTDAMMAIEYGRGGLDTLFGKAARECFSARTGADGRFRLPNFPAGCLADLAVNITGKAQRPFDPNAPSLTFTCGSGDEDIQLRVGPAGAVEGKVIAEETGQPVPGVTIRLEPTGRGLYRSEHRDTVESGADGTFRIADVQPGAYGILPGQPFPGWVFKPMTPSVTVVAGETARGVTVLASKGGVVEVSVVMTNELTPVAGALVFVWGFTAYTGTNGVALIRLPAGPYSFYASKDWTTQQCKADIQAGRVNKVSIQLIPAPSITGVVRGSSGAAVPGALVSFHAGNYGNAPDYTEVTADKNGRYEMILKLSGEYRAWPSPSEEMKTNFLLARSVERNLAAIRDFVEIPTNLDLDLQPGITFSGSVKDPAGAPVTNATVDFGLEPFRSRRQTGAPSIKVNAQGTFSLAAMPRGRIYYSFQGVTARGYGTVLLDMMRFKAPETNRYEFPPFVLKRADRKLAGHILSSDGKVVAGATVRFEGEGQPRTDEQPGVKTDRQGHFAFDAVCEGVVTVSASSNNIQGRAPAHGGDTNIVIQLSAPNGAPANLPVPGGPIY